MDAFLGRPPMVASKICLQPNEVCGHELCSCYVLIYSFAVYACTHMRLTIESEFSVQLIMLEQGIGRGARLTALHSSMDFILSCSCLHDTLFIGIPGYHEQSCKVRRRISFADGSCKPRANQKTKVT